MTKEILAVEWSPSQRMFHVQTVAKMLRDNLAAFKTGTMTDYFVIGLFEDEREMDAFLLAARSERGT